MTFKKYFPIRGTFVMCTTLSLVGRFGQMVKKQTPCIFSWLFWKQSPAKSGEGVLNSAKSFMVYTLYDQILLNVKFNFVLV